MKEFTYCGIRFRVEFVKEHYSSNVFNEYKIIATYKDAIFRLNFAFSKNIIELAKFLKKSDIIIWENRMMLYFTRHKTLKLKRENRMMFNRHESLKLKRVH